MFVVYHKETTRRLDRIARRCNKDHFETMAAAKAALTRAIRNEPDKIARDDFAFAEVWAFYNTIEQKVIKTNILSGLEFTIGVNAPACVDPSTETYHCM